MARGMYGNEREGLHAHTRTHTHTHTHIYIYIYLLFICAFSYINQSNIKSCACVIMCELVFADRKAKTSLQALTFMVLKSLKTCISVINLN